MQGAAVVVVLGLVQAVHYQRVWGV
jgi:hypothetical protein